MAAASPDAVSFAVLKEIAAGKFRPLYVLFGGEAVLAEEIVAALKSKVVAAGLEPFDLEVVHGTDLGEDRLSVQDVLQRVRQPPLGSPRRLVVVRDLELLDKRLGRELCKGLAGLPDTCCVAATCDYDAAWQRIFSEAKMADAVVKLKPPTGAELVELVKRWAGARKLVLSSAAVAAMVECAGEETALLKGEVEKLATLFDPGTRIGEDEVRRVVSNTRGYELREYVDSIWPRRDTANALLVLNRLSSAGEAPVRIIYWLTTKLLDWVWSAKKGQAALERALDRLYEINYQVLQGHPEPYALLDVLTVCVGCFGQGPCGLSRLEKRPGFCLAARQPESRAN